MAYPRSANNRRHSCINRTGAIAFLSRNAASEAEHTEALSGFFSAETKAISALPNFAAAFDGKTDWTAPSLS
jgi:hypothetical protein